MNIYTLRAISLKTNWFVKTQALAVGPDIMIHRSVLADPASTLPHIDIGALPCSPCWLDINFSFHQRFLPPRRRQHALVDKNHKIFSLHCQSVLLLSVIQWEVRLTFRLQSDGRKSEHFPKLNTRQAPGNGVVCVSLPCCTALQTTSAVIHPPNP